MPKETFHQLKADKKKRITNAFLREFALKPYDEASLSEVVKQLGIAKGSIYQYFEDKMDLFLYLIEQANSVKASYIATVKRTGYPDFWSYFMDLFKAGLRFDAEHHLESHFLFGLSQNLYSPSVEPIFDKMMLQVVQVFEEMVKAEIEGGLFRNDIPTNIMAYSLFHTGRDMQEHLQFIGLVNPQKSIAQELPVYHHKEELLLEHVQHYINLVKPAFNAPHHDKS
ncbi:hypothetical protein GCM10011506_25270 [Marivirga lumbricoides]|uniref:HTH tetR-type domain-containing protein n=1 Tax=Marivirga lumbricoides TaxID=1046115 RepID=A0ABQ1MGI2_9BACT|nr:hypothetical protein GCM10011506_25270 [Marivirga lumbricoides]